MASMHLLTLYQVAVACLFMTLLVQTLHGQYESLMTPLSLDQYESIHGCDQDINLKKAECKNRGLKTVPQDLYRDIEILDLSNNNITSLLNSSFEKYPFIENLELSSNDIKVIASTAFYPLKNLRFLDLSYNFHLVLPTTGVFKWSKQLSSLNLKSSNLKTLPNDTLKWSPHLDFVYLDDNRFSFINMSSCGTAGQVSLLRNRIEHLTPELFTFKCHVDILDIRENPIQSVDPKVIEYLHVRSLMFGRYRYRDYEVLESIFTGITSSMIKDLIISNAWVGAFPRGFFDPLRDSSLHFLNFNSNYLIELRPYVFSNLINLGQLSITYNRVPIFSIQPDFFQGMKMLRVLTIMYSRLREINPSDQTWKVDLTELYLSGNELVEISPSTFLGLNNLTFLDLSSNKDLTVFQLTALSGLDNIQNISLSGSSIKVLQMATPTLISLSLNSILSQSLSFTPGETFKHSRSLVSLNMSNSELLLDHLWNSTVNASLFDGLSDLNILDLSSNPSAFFELPPGIFQHNSVLKQLNLDNCDIVNIHPLAFTGLESLQKLSLKGNIIHNVHGNLLRGLGNIKLINLADNRIAYLEEAIFSNNTELRNLLLANNRLTRLNRSTFEHIISSSLSLDLSRNPLDCNCDLTWLLDSLKESIGLQLINENDTICSSASMKPLREKPLLYFDPKELCRYNIGLFCLIPLAVISLIVIAIVVHHNRWHLRYRIYLLKLAVLGYKVMRDARAHDEFEFELNIIFYEDDEEWIREHLRPALEEHLPQFQRNVFGDNDLVLGMHYLDSVDYVVSHSYKTVVVLSRAAVHDRWFMLKFRTAMDHVSDTQTEFVVVVFLEDIPDEEIPFLARLYLSDGRPYLYWPDDVRGQEYFWYELAKNLTINLKTNDFVPNE